MEDQSKYVAYVGSYSYTGKAKGITVMDVDVEKGVFIPRTEVKVNNSSYVIASSDGKFLYSIADEGIVAFAILPDGELERINSASINGMRGCHLSLDEESNIFLVSGFHDGKLTAVRRKPDGSIGRIVAEVFHKGLGGVAERSYRPHVTCARMSPDGKYVLAADSGIDQVRIYRFKNRSLKMVDCIRCDLDSSPRYFIYSPDGRFLYLIYEQKNVIDVFSYKDTPKGPMTEKLQTISTVGKNTKKIAAATSLRPSSDMNYLFCGNAGDETASVYRRDAQTGLLTQLCCLPVSGEYPKDFAVFPDDRHLASINHESGTITFFEVDYEKGLLLMNAREIRCNEPNCCTIVKLPQEMDDGEKDTNEKI
ncbi:MAG: lactonase family protein [Clostridiales bacterium]|nr:lactonase family protein [Clostridiales bacterium]